MVAPVAYDAVGESSRGNIQQSKIVQRMNEGCVAAPDQLSFPSAVLVEPMGLAGLDFALNRRDRREALADVTLDMGGEARAAILRAAPSHLLSTAGDQGPGVGFV